MGSNESSKFKSREVIMIAIMLVVAVIWGGSFIAQSEAAAKMPPLSINAFRFCIGGLITFAISKVFDKSRPHETQGYSLELMGAGIITGLVFSVGIGMQQIAMVNSTAGNGGAITNLDVIFLPLLSVLILKRNLTKITWFAIAIAIVGLSLISFSNERFASGDILMIAVAVTIAVRVLLLHKYVASFDPLKVSTVFFLTTGVTSTLASVAINQTPTFSKVVDAGPELAYLTLLSTVFCFTAETVGLKILDPIRIGFIVNLEAVFAAIGGWLLLNETIDLQTFLGFLFIFSAIFLTTMNRIDTGEKFVEQPDN